MPTSVPHAVRSPSLLFHALIIAYARRRARCAWASSEPNITYHDEEWGVPVHDDRKLFEFLILEGAQAGLGWTDSEAGAGVK